MRRKYTKNRIGKGCVHCIRTIGTRYIVPRLHDLPQLNSVYVYCLDRIGNKQWADKYSKVMNKKKFETV